MTRPALGTDPTPWTPLTVHKTRQVARAALACAVTATLSLGPAATASAVADPERAQGAGTAEDVAPGPPHDTRPQGHGEGRPDPAAASQQNRADRSAEHRPAARPTPAPRTAAPAPVPAPGPAPLAANGPEDPAGNNGTAKVDGPAYDGDVRNEPHVSCELRLTFFGFDAGQTADITFTGHAPTGGGTLLEETGVEISDDAAGGAGNDADGVTRTYTVEDLGLADVAPHPQQGYHVKVAVDPLEAPAGAKSKVVWIEPCGEPVAALPAAQPAAAPAGEEEPAASSDVQPVADQLVVTPEGVEVAPATQVLGVKLAASPAAVSDPGTAADGPRQLFSSLPRTGVAGTVLAVLAGLAAAAAGTALRAAGRRRQATSAR